MVKLTMIAHVTDGLPLAEGLDDGRDLKDAEFYKQQVKSLFKNFSRGQNDASRMSVETGSYVFQKLYLDTRTQRNIVKLNDELYEVHQIMTRNIQEVLGVGEKLDQVSEMLTRLSSETRVYAEKARDLNRQHSASILPCNGDLTTGGLFLQALIRKWAPVAIVFGVVFLLFWVKSKIW